MTEKYVYLKIPIELHQKMKLVSLFKDQPMNVIYLEAVVSYLSDKDEYIKKSLLGDSGVVKV